MQMPNGTKKAPIFYSIVHLNHPRLLWNSRDEQIRSLNDHWPLTSELGMTKPSLINLALGKAHVPLTQIKRIRGLIYMYLAINNTKFKTNRKIKNTILLVTPFNSYHIKIKSNPKSNSQYFRWHNWLSTKFSIQNTILISTAHQYPQNHGISKCQSPHI